MDKSALDFATLCACVRAHLQQEHRYAHTVRVARCADVLAQRHGVDPRKARVAGMLHDLARLYSARRLLDECSARGMTIDAFERANPIVLHARLGAVLARELFGISDPEVLSAIDKHTLGAAHMSPLDCVVYLADSLEPGRTFAGRRELADLARHDLRAGMRATLANALRFYQEQGIAVAAQTAAAAQAFADGHAGREEDH